MEDENLVFTEKASNNQYVEQDMFQKLRKYSIKIGVNFDTQTYQILEIRPPNITSLQEN